MMVFLLASILSLTNLCGSVSVDALGGRVISYVPAGGEEVFAMLQDGSGGVALCWPWFANDGPEGCRRHGVARYHEFVEVSRSESPRASELTLRLRSNEATRREFPHDFDLMLVIRLEEKLTLRLIGENTGREPFAVTEMLHPYFRVGDARQCVVRGVDGLTFRDNVHPELGDARVWHGDYAVAEGSKVFAFAGPATVHALELEDPVLKRTLCFTSLNDLKTVVWSPGEASARGKNVTSKLAPGEWKTFVCVENGTCYGDRAYVLRPGERHELIRTVFVMSDRTALASGSLLQSRPHFWYNIHQSATVSGGYPCRGCFRVKAYAHNAAQTSQCVVIDRKNRRNEDRQGRHQERIPAS